MSKVYDVGGPVSTAELLERLQCTDQADRDAARFSCGQRRRLDAAAGLVD